jgi:hypothetical protein
MTQPQSTPPPLLTAYHICSCWRRVHGHQSSLACLHDAWHHVQEVCCMAVGTYTRCTRAVHGRCGLQHAASQACICDRCMYGYEQIRPVATLGAPQAATLCAVSGPAAVPPHNQELGAQSAPDICWQPPFHQAWCLSTLKHVRRARAQPCLNIYAPVEWHTHITPSPYPQPCRDLHSCTTSAPPLHASPQPCSAQQARDALTGRATPQFSPPWIASSGAF